MKKLELLKQRFFSFLYHSLLRFNRKKRVKARINWAQEIRIAFLTSILFLLFTTSFLWLAHIMSPDELSRTRFNRFLSNQIIHAIHASSQESEIEFSQTIEAVASGTLKSDTLLVCGSIKGLDSSPEKSFRFISVWERDEYSFFNELLNTKPKYNIALLLTSDEELFSKTLMFDNALFEDVNDDKQEDIHITLQSHFGDRISDADIFIINTNSGWMLSSPDFSNIDNEIVEQVKKEIEVHYEEFQLKNVLNPSENETIYSLSNGTLYKVKNQIWGGQDFLFVFSVSNYDGQTRNKYSAFKMMRFDSMNQLVVDNNWNSGSVYLEQNEDYDIVDIIEKNWGIQFGGLVFYSPDVR